MGLVVRIDRPADFGDPQGDVEVGEEGEGVVELVAVEGALGLPDDDGIEVTVRVAEGREECGGSGAPLPGQGAGMAGVEVLGDNLTARGFAEGAGTGELPVP
ncbi:hypothetical protein [Streptomyces sp. cg2]|uniref:hypothetical protein n=1 Tax=Streptomyces sp. cg2 TaxID=3238799 RepID=UPI0034E1C188